MVLCVDMKQQQGKDDVFVIFPKTILLALEQSTQRKEGVTSKSGQSTVVVPITV